LNWGRDTATDRKVGKDSDPLCDTARQGRKKEKRSEAGCRKGRQNKGAKVGHCAEDARGSEGNGNLKRGVVI